MIKERKNNVISGEEHYTNLMLIVVAEAMVLLIMQMLIFNGFKYAAYVAPVMNVVVPVILGVAGVVTVVSAVLWFVKKKNAVISLVFGAYVTLLMCVIRYIPNEFSQSLGRLIPNYLKGQKIGAALSVLYVVAGILYCILAERKRRNLKK